MERITTHVASHQPTSHASDRQSGILRGVVAMVLAVLGTAVLLFGFFLEAFKRIEGFRRPLLSEKSLCFSAPSCSVPALSSPGKRPFLDLAA